MKRSFILIALVLIAGGVTNCKAGPTKRLATAEIVLEATVSSLADLRDAGHIDAVLEAKLTPFVEAAYAALLRMREALETDSSDFDLAWDAFHAAVGVLMEEEARLGGDA